MSLMMRTNPVDTENVNTNGVAIRCIVPALFLLTVTAWSQTTEEPLEAESVEEEALATAPEEADEVRSSLDLWRETLMYGINSEIIDLLPQLSENGVVELADEVETLVRESENSTVLAEAVQYFSELELYSINDRAFELLQQYEVRPPEFVLDLAEYLGDAEAQPSSEQFDLLFDIARDSNVLRSRAAVRLLGTTVEDTTELIELYQDNDLPEDTRGAILVALGDRGDPAAFEFVAELIGENEEATSMLQRYAIDTLGRLGDDRAIPIILRQLDSNDATTRAYAVNALSGFETPEATDAILDSLRDDFWRVRVAALKTIADRKIVAALDVVIYKARRDPEQAVRLEAVDTLRALDRPAGWDALREAATTNRTALAERTRIIAVLVESNYPQSEETLLNLVQQEWEIPNSPILDAIGRAVSIRDTSETANLVERLVLHPNYIIQIYAIRAVGNGRIVSLRDILQQRSEEEGNHRAVRSAALRSLEQLAGP